MFIRFADSPQSFAGGNTGTDTGSEVSDSVFIGQSDNRGQPQLFVDQSEMFSNLIAKPSVLLNTSFASSPYVQGEVTGMALGQRPSLAKLFSNSHTHTLPYFVERLFIFVRLKMAFRLQDMEL